MPLTSTEHAGLTTTAPRGVWSQVAAALYDPFLALGEHRGMRERRRRLLRRARGTVLEIGAGTGLNLAHYPDELDELVLSEPVDPMARRLESRLHRSGVPGRVLRTGAEALPVATGSVDTVVSTMVLCTVPDTEAVLAEIRRVLRPDGRLLFCEHVRSDSRRLSRWQERLAGPWEAFADGCRCNQDTLALIEQALRIDRLEREEWRGMPGLVRPLIVGEARADAVNGDQEAMDEFARVAGAVTSPATSSPRRTYDVSLPARASGGAPLRTPRVSGPVRWNLPPPTHARRSARRAR